MHRQRNGRRMAILILLVAITVAACGGGTDTATEQTAESATGAENNGASADVESSGATETIQMGGELPTNLPVPVPDGGSVTSVVVMSDGGWRNLNMTFEGDRVEEFIAFYQAWIGNNATEVVFESVSSDNAQWSVEYAGDKQASIGIAGAKDNEGSVQDTILQVSP